MLLYNKNSEVIGHTFFDKEDLDKIKPYKWTFDKDGYIMTIIKDKRVLLHRLVLNYFGKDDIDHINHLVYDNRKQNLRVVTRSQNLNIEMVRKCNFVIAFWDGYSYGTAHTIAWATKYKIPIKVITIKKEDIK